MVILAGGMPDTGLAAIGLLLQILVPIALIVAVVVGVKCLRRKRQ